MTYKPRKNKDGSVTMVPVDNSTEELSNSNYAPVRNDNGGVTMVQAPTAKDERKWFQKGAFEDGYDFGDLTKTIVGTSRDITENLYAGILGIGESVVDAGAYAIGGVAGLFGGDGVQDKMQEFIAKDLYDEKEVAKWIVNHSSPSDYLQGQWIDTDEDSVLGEKTEGIVQSGGQLAGTVALQAAGVPWWVTTGVTSFGSEAESAFKQGASYGEAGVSAAITAGAEILTEKISGGIKFGGKTLDDGLTRVLAKGISNKFGRNLLKVGVDVAGEGLEEVLSEAIGRFGQWLTYQDDKTIGEMLASEEAMDSYIESFIGGAALGGVGSGTRAISGAVQGVDAVSEMTANEEKVFKREYESRIAEEEKGGKKLTAKEKNKIYDAVMNDIEKGRISADTVGEVLGGDTYKDYKANTESVNKLVEEQKALQKEYDTLQNIKRGEMTGVQEKREAELETQLAEIKTQIEEAREKGKGYFNTLRDQVKDDRLVESYNEVERRGQAFQADVMAYKGKAREIVKKAVDSGVLNNTNRSHELVDLIAKIAADKGTDFDFTNNQKLKESGFAVDGKFVNGYLDKKTGTIGVNIQSAKALNTVVGHEVTHILEGTELYGELQTALFDYAKSKKDFDARRKALESLYAAEDVDSELAADLVGDYLFTDESFIRNLSTKHRNVFQKIYDEIKYLCKVATAGSKEARELEKVKRAFEKAYREGGKTDAKTTSEAQKNTAEDSGVKYSLEQVDGIDYVKAEKNIFTKEDGTPATERDVFNSLVGKTISLPNGDIKIVRSLPGKNMYNELYKRFPNRYQNVDDVKQLNSDVNYNMGELLSNSQTIAANIPDANNKHQKQGITSFDTQQVKFYDGNKAYNVEFSIATMESGEKIAYAKKFFGYDAELTKKIQAAETKGFTNTRASQQPASNGSVPQTEENVKTQFSLSSDSDGKQLSKGQQEYFKDSKVRDENGNLKVMYHGSQDAGFHEFDAKFSDDDTSFFFVDSNDVAASYSETSETYEARTIRSAEDMNAFIEEIGAEGYEVVEKDGKFTLLYEGDRVAASDTPQGIYDEFCWYEGVGEGDANYKVYLNLTNPLEVDVEGRNWNNISREFSQELADKYNSLTDAEKGALMNLASWEEISIFRDELRQALADTETGAAGSYDAEFAWNVRRAYEKLGGSKVNMYDLFTIASDGFSAESINQFAVHQMNTRDYAKKAKAEGYDGVIFKNIVDVGGYGNGSEGASTVAIAFNSNQIKSVANENPTGDKDIRYSLSAEADKTYLDAVERGDTEAAQKMVDEAAKNAGYDIKAYHGTPNADFTVFDRDRVGKGNDQYGAGFYFTTSKTGASHYGKRVIDAALSIKNPIRFTATTESGRNLIDADITLTSEQAYEVVKRLPDIYDAEESPLGDYFDAYWEVGAKDWMIRELAEQYRDVGYLDSDLFRNYPNELHEALRDVVGYDGVEVTFESTGEKFYVAWFDNQMKSTDPVTYDDNGKVIPLSERFNTEKNDIRNSLSAEGEAPVKHGNYNIYGEDIRLEQDIAPVDEAVDNSVAEAPIAEMPDGQSLQDLYAERDELEGQIREAIAANDQENGAPLVERYNEVTRQIRQMEADERESFNALLETEAPPETEAPYYGEEEAVSVDDPFEARDIDAVGNRKVKAYMYENPEVKPFFQEEARVLLGELESTEKAQSVYLGDYKYNLPYDAAKDLPELYRISRQTTPDIAYMRDTLNMSYADIEKGLKAIIEDHGAENIAAAKKIEFIINDRLMNGYNQYGADVPANEGYINLLNEKQILEYSEEARAKFFEAADEYAPPEDIAPVTEKTAANAAKVIAEDIAPVAEQYEAIKPQKERKKASEPKMKRVDAEEAKRGGEKERSWYETSTGSEAVDGAVTPDDIPDDVRYYKVKPNKKTLATANARLERLGYAKSREYFENRMADRKLSVEDIALGERLIQEAAKAGDAKAVRDLIIDVSILGTELGQRVQALSIIRRLTPEGQLRALQRTIDRGKAKGDKAYEGVEITEDMAKRITDTVKKDGTFDQAELNQAVEDVKQQIADQMPVGALDYVNAWRYLSMLGNPKTHIRNVVSNVAMMGTRAVKNAVARTIEGIAPIKTRTKTWARATDTVKSFAEQATVDMDAAIKGDSKYSEEGSIKEKRQIFKTKAGNWLADKNSSAMEWEDALFSKMAFRRTLQEYLTANGIKTEADIKNNAELVEKAKDYALEEARKATFRQDSYLANKISEVEKKNPFFGMAVGSVMPFKKTPINIAKTAVGYSPLGFARNIYDAVQVKKGNMDASEAVDHLAQSITGTALALIGFALANAGVLNGAGEDDKEGKYDYQLGEQSYSFNFGGDSYSLSWLSPVAMPLFVGANAYEKLVEKEEWDMNVVIDTLAQTLDPLSEMSFLSSLDDVLSSYDSGMAKIWGAGESMVQNYITQFVPTLSSQLAATVDDTKRSTKASGDSGWEFGEETLNKILYKIPFARNTLEPTTDIWGNEVKQNENVMARGFESFLSPANKREGIATAVDDELKALYGETGKTELLPSIPYDYINYKDVKYDMSAEDFTAYKQNYGQTAYEMLESLFATDTYRNADAETRADLVSDVYDYARDLAKRNYLAKQGVDFYNATKDNEEVFKENPIKGAIENDMMPDEYTFSVEYPAKYAVAKSVGGYKTWKTYSSELYDIKADKDEDGKSINGSRKEKVIEYINNLDADYGEKIILFKSEYNADDTYNYDIIDYLNGREDISYQEMETILKELGFTVSSDGRITW